MKYSFSTHFLKILHPDSNFGEAWESLCFDLLKEEYPNGELRKLAAPDKGIDILLQNSNLRAIQCKSDERGASGSLSHNSSVDSLRTAFGVIDILKWDKYYFATNASYTGNATVNILEEAKILGLNISRVKFWEAEFWSDLCERHFEIVKHRLDYRLLFSEQEVIEAFVKARYYDKYVQEYGDKIRNSDFKLKVKNNRTPLVLEFPFSPELTVKHCVDIVKNLLGISLDWTNFRDLGTSAGPSISLTINKYAQSFNKKIGELELSDKDDLEFWIKIIWKDEIKREGADDKKLNYLNLMTLYYDKIILEKQIDDFSKLEINRETFNVRDREKITLQREEEIIQNTIWNSVPKK